MKKITLFCLLAIITQMSIAQCVRTGTLVAIDEPSQYPVTGTSTQTFLINGTKQLSFGDDFVTVQGIQLRVFLSTTERLSDTGNESIEVTTEPLQDDNGGQDMGDAITGPKTFDIPSSVEINDFNYVIIQCVSADVLWGRATLGTPNGADCEILEIEDFQEILFILSPNPASSQISISGVNLNNSEIRIFDILGKQVYQNTIVANKTLDISALNSGVYLVSVVQEGTQTTKKLVVE
jgi:hypothetical protein